MVLLIPSVHTAAYFEHAFPARTMGMLESLLHPVGDAAVA
ncbi:hypothetical protein [Nonomuraea sp. NPDC049784]